MLFPVILLLSLLSSFVLHWWVACILAFIASLFLGKTSAQSFWSGFAGLGLVWLALALIKSFPNQHILATRVAHLFHLPHWLLLLLVTVIIGGFAGGMSALSGRLMKKVFEKNG